VTGIIDNSTDESRKRWCELLHAGWMFHQQQVKDGASPIIGAEISDDQLFHMSISVAIQDAIALIQQMEAYGYFEDEDFEEEMSKPGPAG
tara:strand:+ start:7185 stop:7454 length:270 start_codon:yes stop_codon:yes gene_type:complete